MVAVVVFLRDPRMTYRLDPGSTAGQLSESCQNKIPLFIRSLSTPSEG